MLQANKVKQIMEFKVRVLDFIAIYIKEAKKNNKELDSHHLIKGLLKAMQVAQADKNTILFERIKSVLTLIARGNPGQNAADDESSNKDSKMLITEVMALVLKPTKDAAMH